MEQLIAGRLREAAGQLHASYAAHAARGVGWAVIDDLLPAEDFARLTLDLPPIARMHGRRSLGERKHVLARRSDMAPPLRALVGALASPEVAALVGTIAGCGDLRPDAELYNGGLTAMMPGDHMRPHLDNSHDRSGTMERRIATLFYASPRWNAGQGGALRLWRTAREEDVDEIPFRPNRLVLIEVSDRAWHSVEAITGNDPRLSVTTYYYQPARGQSRVRLTRFRGWPGERATTALLSLAFGARSLGARLGMRRLVRNRHVDGGADALGAVDPERPVG